MLYMMVPLQERNPNHLFIYSVEVHIYIGFLDLEGEVHSIWELWTSGLQKCKGNDFSKSSGAGNIFQSGSKHLNIFWGVVPALIHLPLKARKGRFTSPVIHGHLVELGPPNTTLNNMLFIVTYYLELHNATP